MHDHYISRASRSVILASSLLILLMITGLMSDSETGFDFIKALIASAIAIIISRLIVLLSYHMIKRSSNKKLNPKQKQFEI